MDGITVLITGTGAPGTKGTLHSLRNNFDNRRIRIIGTDINKDVIGAVYDPNIAVNDPVRLTIALAENAKQNGINIMTETEVMSISRGTEEFEVQTNDCPVKCRFIVNAAGEYVGKIAQMVNADDFVLYPVKAYQGVLDKNLAGVINHMILSEENGMVTPTVHGNLFFGISPGTQRLGKTHVHSTDKKLADTALRHAQELVPDISARHIINSFVGFILYRNFEVGWHECTIGSSRWVPRFINAVSASPEFVPPQQ